MTYSTVLPFGIFILIQIILLLATMFVRLQKDTNDQLVSVWALLIISIVLGAYERITGHRIPVLEVGLLIAYAAVLIAGARRLWAR